MSGAIIYTPATGADWATAWEQAEYARKGKMGISLTNYDATTLPAIAAGSWAEVAGSIYKWTAEEAISGSLTSTAINYIKLVPSGSGDTAIVTATWTDVAPTWSDAYQGWYSGTSRYVAGCFYDGTYYKLKIILENRAYQIVEVTVAIPYVGDSWLEAEHPANFSTTYAGLATGDSIIVNVYPPHKGIVTEFALWTDGAWGGTIGVQLERGRKDDGTTAEVMAQLFDTGSDTSISYSEIDIENYFYVVHGKNSSGVARQFHGAHVKIVTRFPKVELY